MSHHMIIVAFDWLLHKDLLTELRMTGETLEVRSDKRQPREERE